MEEFENLTAEQKIEDTTKALAELLKQAACISRDLAAEGRRNYEEKFSAVKKRGGYGDEFQDSVESMRRAQEAAERLTQIDEAIKEAYFLC